MITRLKNRLRRFRKEDAGALYSLEFLVLLPALTFPLLFGVELTTHSNRQFQLDRGLEVTTREIRLNTGFTFTHEQIKGAICANSGGLAECDSRLRLEMVPMDPRNYAGLPRVADCVNVAQPVNPVRGWSLGQQHQLMVMRACYKYDPFSASFGMGNLFATDNTDELGTMVSMSAFVQEPQ
jgi:hypothetical protein